MMPFKFESLFGEEFTKNLAGFSSLPFFDVKPLLDIQKKNFEALSEAGTLALEGLQAMAKSQTEFFSQAVENTSSIMQEVIGEGTPEQKAMRQADLAKKSYEKSVTNWREITEIARKSTKVAADVINGRVISSLTEFKSTLDKKTAAKSGGQKKAA
ncbi:MAG: phasin [Alphaproteobacteria bacterium CG_4_9_14_3_um_filter_47_13]|nr:MAG: phasin [Alphaproteobacteria bacterium CG_4_9_14_3_um_filter_47_13]